MEHPDRTPTENVDVVVVGSGYGGSVAAYRLAQAGLSVVVLERGRAYPPGSFARTATQLAKGFWDPRVGLYGLFDLRHFRSFDSIVASGLGGGSLINANVMLRKDENWFVPRQALPGGGYESWPITRADLEPHYEAVERMLGATPYPLDQPAYRETGKTHALREAAEALGREFHLPPLAVSFAPQPGGTPEPGLLVDTPAYGNLHGVPRRTCRLCAECNAGCNEGAKNSLDHTYLSAARHYGADLRIHHEARMIRRRDRGGWVVDYRQHRPGENSPKAGSIGCERLVLAAGTYGTCWLLLRSRRGLPAMSPALGTRFSSNGDVLSFLVEKRQTPHPRRWDPSVGPVITASLRLPDELDGPEYSGRGGYIQDGGYPTFMSWLLECTYNPRQITKGARFAAGRIRAKVSRNPDTQLSQPISELIGPGNHASAAIPLLGMGRDLPDGVMRLRNDQLVAEWSPTGSKAYFQRISDTIREMADVLGTESIDHPLGYGKRIVSVHPVGGAPMANHGQDGVCDPFGEVFGCPGLYVADGSAIPGPVGTNPSLTIAALADRMCTHVLDNRSTTGKHASRSLPATQTWYPNATSLTFTERLRGRYAPGVRDARWAKRSRAATAITARLTVTIDDVAAFLDDPTHRSRLAGWVDSPTFGGRQPIRDGWLDIFPQEVDNPVHALRYHFTFTDTGNQPRLLAGHKTLTGKTPLHLWPETTTLSFHLFDGRDQQKRRILGAGALGIPPTDFLRQLTTFRTTGPNTSTALEEFGRFFLGNLWERYT